MAGVCLDDDVSIKFNTALIRINATDAVADEYERLCRENRTFRKRLEELSLFADPTKGEGGWEVIKDERAFDRLLQTVRDFAKNSLEEAR